MPSPQKYLPPLAAGAASLYSPDSEAVVKLPGGNWLSGSVPSALRSLRRGEGPLGPVMQALHGKSNAALNSFIDRQLTDYVTNRMASPKDELRIMADAWPEKQGALVAVQQAKIDKARTKLEKLQRERPNDPLPRSVAELNALEGGLKAIQARQGLHSAFDRGGSPSLWRRRIEQKFPRDGLAETDVGRAWEEASDYAVVPGTLRELSSLGQSVNPHWPDAQKLVAGEMRRLWGQFGVDNPTATGFRLRGGSSTSANLGLDHLIDEMHNALNDPDLPAHLRINPEDLPKWSMQQAVDRVADINAHRAVKKAETDKIRANNAAVKTVREYPSGHRWVEFGQPELPKGYRTVKEGDTLRVMDSEGREIANFVDRPDRNAAHQAKDHFGKKTLQDALNYEADVMQHCVRGYCDKVVGGESRILSLRDAEGRPHVTVEVNPGRFVFGDIRKAVGEVKADEMFDRGLSLEEMAREIGFSAPPKITQIKGPRNLRPDDPVIPMVQDLVRNPEGLSPAGRWADSIGDLGFTDMFKVSKGQRWPGFAEEMPEGYYTFDEAHRMAQEKGMDPEVLENWMSKLKSLRPGWNPY